MNSKSKLSSNRVHRIVVIFVFGLCASTTVFAAQFPTVDGPPDSQVIWVAKDMVQNGVPMQIKAFYSDTPVSDVLAHYRSNWSAASKQRPVENTVGDWQIIGMQQGSYYLSVQVKSGTQQASEGFIGVSLLPALDEEPRLDNKFPRLGGTEVVSDTRSNDDGKKAKTLILQNNYSIESNASFYRSNLPAQGWQQRQDINASSLGKDGHVLYFERPGEAVQIAINRSSMGKTSVLVNIVETRL